MVGEFALSILLSPVGVMLAGAVASGLYAFHAWRSGSQTEAPDALAGLFQREDFAEQVHDPKLQHIRARGQQRTVQSQPPIDPSEREAMLRRAAAVMRGSERDAGIVRAATRYLAGEGFVLMENVAHARSGGVIAEVVEFEEVKLLPPPSPARAA